MALSAVSYLLNITFLSLQIQIDVMLTGWNLGNVVNSGALNKGGMGRRANKGEIVIFNLLPLFILKNGKRV